MQPYMSLYPCQIIRPYPPVTFDFLRMLSMQWGDLHSEHLICIGVFESLRNTMSGGNYVQQQIKIFFSSPLESPRYSALLICFCAYG